MPGSSRLVETSQGIVLIVFWSDSANLVEVPADGWVRVPIVAETVRAARSLQALADALADLGVDAGEARQLAAQEARAWQAIPFPAPRTVFNRVGRSVRLVALTPGILVRLPLRLARTRRHPEAGGEFTIEHVPPVWPGSPEYGMARLARTSRGWAEFEFWGGPAASLGIYGANGWLPFTRSRRPLFEATEAGAVAALVAQGVPESEATQLGRRVIGERLSRTGSSTSPTSRHS